MLFEEFVKKTRVREGDEIRLRKDGQEYRGVLMPRSELADPEHLVLKLSNGYNIGLKLNDSTEAELIRRAEKPLVEKQKVVFDPSLPKVVLLSAGGTISSKVDYRSGAVIPLTSPEELLAAVPELSEVANISAKTVFRMFSEDMQPGHYSLLAKAVKKEIENGAGGVVIAHGTDTMHYTSSMLSFMLKDLPVPVVLVGSQRSSDRGSSDAAMNLFCATVFAANADYAGVVVCMHGTMNDDYCLIHPGTKVRKMHTSRRDAFRTINASPLARVFMRDKKIEFLSKGFPNRDAKRKLVCSDKLEEKVGFLKLHPGVDPGLLDYYLDNGYKALVLEGMALGHAPINKTDEMTSKNKLFFEKLKKLCGKMIVVMASQCVYGRVNMNVYSTGRDLLNIGVVPASDMLPEVAYAKLMWLLGNHSTEESRELFSENLAGEITAKTIVDSFLI